MKSIKIIKTTEKLPLERAVNLCLGVLKKPKEISQNKWRSQIKKDLITGRKFFRVRELVLGEKVD